MLGKPLLVELELVTVELFIAALVFETLGKLAVTVEILVVVLWLAVELELDL